MSYDPTTGFTGPVQFWAGGRETYDLDAPALLVGALQFNKGLYTFSAIRFKAVAARGDAVDAEVNLAISGGATLATLTFSTTAIGAQQSADISGAIPAGATVLEASINLAAAPGGSDAVELYQAWLEVIP